MDKKRVINVDYYDQDKCLFRYIKLLRENAFLMHVQYKNPNEKRNLLGRELFDDIKEIFKVFRFHYTIAMPSISGSENGLQLSTNFFLRSVIQHPAF